MPFIGCNGNEALNDYWNHHCPTTCAVTSWNLRRSQTKQFFILIFIFVINERKEIYFGTWKAIHVTRYCAHHTVYIPFPAPIKLSMIHLVSITRSAPQSIYAKEVQTIISTEETAQSSFSHFVGSISGQISSILSSMLEFAWNEH